MKLMEKTVSNRLTKIKHKFFQQTHHITDNYGMIRRMENTRTYR